MYSFEKHRRPLQVFLSNPLIPSVINPLHPNPFPPFETHLRPNKPKDGKDTLCTISGKVILYFRRTFNFTDGSLLELLTYLFDQDMVVSNESCQKKLQSFH